MILSPEDKELAKLMWEHGSSGTEIGTRFGKTRNAICGMAYRNNWQTPNSPDARRAAPTERQERVARSRAAKNEKSALSGRRMRIAGPNYMRPARDDDPELPGSALDNQAIPILQRKTILELKPGICHWPCGDPGTPEFFYCGGESVSERPYCALHCRAAFQPPRDRSNNGQRAE